MNRLINKLTKKFKQTSEHFEKNISNFFNKNKDIFSISNSNSNSNSHFAAKSFQKVECYSIHDTSKVQVNKNYDVLTDKDINKQIRLNKMQMDQLRVYIGQTLTEFSKGDIYISKEDLKKYEQVSEFLYSQNTSKPQSELINKELVDFILKDLIHSYQKQGFKGDIFRNSQVRFYDDDNIM